MNDDSERKAIIADQYYSELVESGRISSIRHEMIRRSLVPDWVGDNPQDAVWWWRDLHIEIENHKKLFAYTKRREEFTANCQKNSN